MKFVTEFASDFMGLFQSGGKTFVGWMTTIIPTVLLLLVLMNAIIAFVGDKKISKLARASSKNL